MPDILLDVHLSTAHLAAGTPLAVDSGQLETRVRLNHGPAVDDSAGRSFRTADSTNGVFGATYLEPASEISAAHSRAGAGG